MAVKKVKIYTTDFCVYCKAAKDFLLKNKIPFEEINVGEDEEALNEMIQLSGQMGVPVIVVDDEVIVGFNEPKLRKLLKVENQEN
ncbi:MAG: glutaredoxin family protein [Candidatus Nanoarchaeia archaeon]